MHWLWQRRTHKVYWNDRYRKRLPPRCIITHSNSSKSGKYHCLNVELIVQTEEVRNGLYQTLKNHPAIRIVL
ncbi:MAG: DUF493 family protein [Deltaproteobacteria bacterium]